MELILDINNQIYPVHLGKLAMLSLKSNIIFNFLFHCIIILGDKFRFLSTINIREDGFSNDTEWNPEDAKSVLAESFDYVAYGKVYKIESDEGQGDASRL